MCERTDPRSSMSINKPGELSPQRTDWQLFRGSAHELALACVQTRTHTGFFKHLFRNGHSESIFTHRDHSPIHRYGAFEGILGGPLQMFTLGSGGLVWRVFGFEGERCELENGNQCKHVTQAKLTKLLCIIH